MTDYWVSNERYYCKDCGCWMDAKPSSIRKHEQGFRHKGNAIKALNKIKRAKILAKKEANKHLTEFAAIERAAKRQYIKDCANGLSSSTGVVSYNHSNSNNNNHYKQRKDNLYQRSFLPSDNDEYYYLDKEGKTHGPYTRLKMCIWNYFGFFVGALRLRKRENIDFIHLRDIDNPFNYTEFQNKIKINKRFRENVLNSIDISNVATVPPGLDIPQKLKDEFNKLYPSNKIKNKSKTLSYNSYRNNNIGDLRTRSSNKNYKNTNIGSGAGTGSTRSSNSNYRSRDNNNFGDIRNSNKNLRKKHIMGNMRKYKQKCMCGDSDCHLKHNHNHHVDDDDDSGNDNDEDDDLEHSKTKNDKTITPNKSDIKKDPNIDEFGFGKWERITKKEFDKKHSNKHLLKKRGKKRWWRDKINANLPIAKRKKLMGIDEMASDEERDYDKLYGIDQIIQNVQNMRNDNDNGNDVEYNQSTNQIAISFDGTKINSNNVNNDDGGDGNDDDLLLNDEDILVRNAKKKLKKEKEIAKKKQLEHKKIVMNTLDEFISIPTDKDYIDKDFRFMEQIKQQNGVGDINKKTSLFKKKKKKKKKQRQRGSIVTNIN